MMRDLVEPFGLLVALPPRVARHGAILVARAAHRAELLVEQALTEPVALRGWSGVALDDVGPAASAVVDLTDNGLAATESATGQGQRFGSVSERSAQPDAADLRALLDHERTHGNRARFEQLLRRRLGDAGIR